jgi:hypothetical protein
MDQQKERASGMSLAESKEKTRLHLFAIDFFLAKLEGEL